MRQLCWCTLSRHKNLTRVDLPLTCPSLANSIAINNDAFAIYTRQRPSQVRRHVVQRTRSDSLHAGQHDSAQQRRCQAPYGNTGIQTLASALLPITSTIWSIHELAPTNNNAMIFRCGASIIRCMIPNTSSPRCHAAPFLQCITACSDVWTASNHPKASSHLTPYCLKSHGTAQ